MSFLSIAGHTDECKHGHLMCVITEWIAQLEKMKGGVNFLVRSLPP